MFTDFGPLEAWGKKHQVDTERLFVEQRALINAALQFLEFVGYNRLLVRFVVYFLTHCGVKFTASCVAKVVGRSERAIEQTKSVGVTELVESAHRDGDRHGKPTLDPAHAGPIAQFIFEHRSCTFEEIADFCRDRLEVDVGIDGVRAFLRRHGLANLRQTQPTAPLF